MTYSYTNGMQYELLIRRAFKCEKTLRNGADNSFMRNLIDAENGVKQFKLGTKEKQLEVVKKYLLKACDKFLKFDLTKDEKSVIEHNKTIIIDAYSSSDLLLIVDTLLSLTQRFK